MKDVWEEGRENREWGTLDSHQAFYLAKMPPSHDTYLSQAADQYPSVVSAHSTTQPASPPVSSPLISNSGCYPWLPLPPSDCALLRFLRVLDDNETGLDTLPQATKLERQVLGFMPCPI